MGLGSNVGDRVKNLTDAIATLKADRDMHVLSVSPFYETEAEGPPQAAFINGALLVLTSMPAADLLDRMLAVEAKLGRVRSPETAKGPRTIDLDILWIEGESVDEENLRVPHPRLRDRTFALRPLLDLAPDARDQDGNAFADCDAAKVDLKKI